MTDDYGPLCDRVMRGWIVRKAQREFWRVASWMEMDDLIQDGFMCFAKCRQRYPQFDVPNPTKDQKRHFMALVKTTFTNHIHNLAAKRPFSEVLAEDHRQEVEALDNRTFQEGPLRQLLTRLPEDLRDALVLLATDLTPQRPSPDCFRGTLNEKIARVLGLPAMDYVGALRKYLQA